jgi:hypothetical protein
MAANSLPKHSKADSELLRYNLLADDTDPRLNGRSKAEIDVALRNARAQDAASAG